MTRPVLPAAATLGFVSLLGLMLLLPEAGGPRAETDATEYALWSPYWTLQPGFTSTLEMKNNLAEEGLTVHVWLYSAAGEEQYLQAVPLEPRQTAIVNLNSAIDALPAPVAARLGKQGSAKITFTGHHPSNLMGAITVTNPERGIAWNFRLYPSFPELPVAPVRGLFWLYDGETDGLVAAQNASEEFITLHPSFDIAGTSHPLPPVPLAPGQSFLLSLRRELERLGLSEVRLGGIEFTYEGPGDALQAHGALFNQRGFSAEIDFHRFTRWDERRDFTQRTPRFALGRADPVLGLPAPTVFEPVLLLHNFNRHPLDVTLAVGYRTADGPQETQIPLQLAAGESQILELTEHLSGVVPPETHWASLELGYSDWHNGLAAALVSVSRDGEHTLNSVLNWVIGTNHEGWYWQVDADRNTLLAIFNRRPEAVTVAVSLDYSVAGVSQSYDLPERTIPGRSTDMVDIGEVIAAGVPDGDGDVIPASVSFGGYRVRKLGPDGEGALTTEALVLDRRRKTYASYYNTGCCYYSPPRLNPTSLSGTVSGLFQITLTLKNACTSAWEEALDPFYWSGSTSIAAVDSTWGDGNFVGVGSTSLWGRVRYFKVGAGECPMSTESDPSSATVFSVSVGISPASVPPGGETTVTVSVLPALEGRTVSLSPQEVPYSGGHQHLGRLLGTLAATSGTTNAQGKFITTYTASQFGGGEVIKATHNTTSGPAVGYSPTLIVRVLGLSPLSDGANFDLKGSTTAHPDNHYGNATALAKLPVIADQYAALFPGSVLEYDDMSLVTGGQFDIGPTTAHPEWQFWQIPHEEHRFGANCDVHKSNVPSARWPDLRTIFINNGSGNFLEHPDHWHLRF
jgi:hypothetical protein